MEVVLTGRLVLKPPSTTTDKKATEETTPPSSSSAQQEDTTPPPLTTTTSVPAAAAAATAGNDGAAVTSTGQAKEEGLAERGAPAASEEVDKMVQEKDIGAGEEQGREGRKPTAASTEGEKEEETAANKKQSEEQEGEEEEKDGDAKPQSKGVIYAWDGKWYFRNNKNKSSTFSYELVWCHEMKSKSSETNPAEQVEKTAEKEFPSAGDWLDASAALAPTTASATATTLAPVSTAEPVKMEKQEEERVGDIIPPAAAAAVEGESPGLLPLSFAAGSLEDDDPIIDEQLHLSLMSDLPSNFLLGEQETTMMTEAFDLNPSLAPTPSMAATVDSLGGLFATGISTGTSTGTAAMSIVQPEITNLLDLFPYDARASCQGAFLVHNPNGAAVNEIAETFDLSIVKPTTPTDASTAPAALVMTVLEVLGEGRNIYGDFILEGKINLQSGVVRMICHRRYKGGSNLMKQRPARKVKPKEETASTATTSTTTTNASSTTSKNTTATLAGEVTATAAGTSIRASRSSSQRSAPAATAAAVASAATTTAAATTNTTTERRASNRITLGVRKTPLFADDADKHNLSMPVAATFASSSSGKLLRAAQACNRGEMRLAWWQWRQQVLALQKAEESQRGRGAGKRNGANNTSKAAAAAAATETDSAQDKDKNDNGSSSSNNNNNNNRGSKRKLSSATSDANNNNNSNASVPAAPPAPDALSTAIAEDSTAGDGWVSALGDEDGEVYEGDVVEGAREGVGICLFPNGLLYQGQWLQGKEHGTGKLMTHGRKVIYEGEWSEGKMNGKGRYVFPSGGVYEGDWRENMRHGQGTYLLPGGARYEGDWKEDLRWGFGAFTWADGSVYEGEWVRGVRQGKGTLKCTEFEYVGQWTGNKMEGKGVCSYSNGQRYEGMWRGGLKDGRGRLVFSDGGAQYEGRFREDQLDGQGTLELLQPLPGTNKGDWVIPLDVNVDVARAHTKAGFTQGGK